jgi:hypothetical protein
MYIDWQRNVCIGIYMAVCNSILMKLNLQSFYENQKKGKVNKIE